MVQRFSLRRQLSKVGRDVGARAGKRTAGRASFLSGPGPACQARLPLVLRRGRQEALPFVLSSDRHKAPRLAALSTRDGVPLKP